MPTIQTLIAVTTGGRQEELRRLLAVLARDYGSRGDVGLLVVDNTPDGTAQHIVDDEAGPFGDRWRYVIVPERGYAAVRNGVVRNADGAAAIAMIDDDEVPTPGWLDGLLAAHADSGADVVAGPIISEFPDGVPPYFAESGVFDMDEPDLEEGAPMPYCATNNTLVQRRVLDVVPEGFDHRFDRMSGEDTDYFMRARLRGCTIAWTRRAVVREHLPAGRLSRRWIFRRAGRVGNTRALVEFDLLGGPGVASKRAVKMVGLATMGTGLTAVAAVRRDRATGLRALHRLGLAYGMLLAFKSRDPWIP